MRVAVIRRYCQSVEDKPPGKRQRLRLGPACDEQLAFLRQHGFTWELKRPRQVMSGECWEASSSAAAVTVCVDRRNGDFSVSIGAPGHRGLDLDVVADRLGVRKDERPRLSARTKKAEGKRVQELAAFLRGPAAPLVRGDFSAVGDLLGP